MEQTASMLNQNSVLGMRRVFDSIDENNDGDVTVQEMMNAFEIKQNAVLKMLEDSGVQHPTEKTTITFDQFVKIMSHPGKSRMAWIPARFVREYREIFEALCHRCQRQSTIFLSDLAFELKTTPENLWSSTYTAAKSIPPCDQILFPFHPPVHKKPLLQPQNHTNQPENLNNVVVDLESFLEMMVDPNKNIWGLHAVSQTVRFDSITEEEGAQPSSELVLEEQLPAVSQELIRELFRLCDVDGNHLLDVVDIQNSTGCDPQKAADMIRQLDEVGDGQVREKEYLEFFSNEESPIAHKLWFVPLSVREFCDGLFAKCSMPENAGERTEYVDLESVCREFGLKHALVCTWHRARVLSAKKSKPSDSLARLTRDQFTMLVLELHPTPVSQHIHHHFPTASRKRCLSCSIL